MQLPEYTQHKDTDKRIKSAIMALKALTVLDLYPEHREELLTVCLWKITTADGNANGKSKKFKIKFAQAPVTWSDVRGTKVSLTRDIFSSLIGLIKIRLNDLQGKYSS